MTDESQLRAVATRAAAAAQAMASAPPFARAGWLRAVADRLDAASAELVILADEETHLGRTRLEGEAARATRQLRLFADAMGEGSFLEAIIDHGDPQAVPPQPELRRMLWALGPVAVFSASNFPFAFSVAGGDTAAAWAAGCPVIVKAHPGHERLSGRTAETVVSALNAAGAPIGAFGMVAGFEAGRQLVTTPAVKAVAFTGSVSGGRALFDLASSRPEPIPFYGELGSINPVVVTSAAVRARRVELARGLCASFTLGVGQYCTKPGIVFHPAGEGFEDALIAALPSASGGPMLDEHLAERFSAGLRRLLDQGGARILATGSGQCDQNGTAAPVVLAASAEQAFQRPHLLYQECFGPVTLLLSYTSRDGLLRALRSLPGSLTATVHAEPSDEVDDLVAVLTERVGRILFAGWPTGVAVTWSQQHGGPWPATTSIHTSVGVTSIRRFQRPIVYQDAPERVLPPALREGNPLRIPRRVDGVLTLRS